MIQNLATQDQVNGINAELNNKSNTGHTHDDRYYTETEIDTKMSGKSNTGHTHDDRYYTETEINQKLSANFNTIEYIGSFCFNGSNTLTIPSKYRAVIINIKINLSDWYSIKCFEWVNEYQGMGYNRKTVWSAYNSRATYVISGRIISGRDGIYEGTDKSTTTYGYVYGIV